MGMRAHRGKSTSLFVADVYLEELTGEASKCGLNMNCADSVMSLASVRP
ncbi:hypothetical protein SAMN06265373_10250 [Shimia sagamensis]|uniref:Uncharacterized protein n=1 Tax=Shimia sagamensis TaxID=1566352 RepID=A0ABY1NHQ8_9RHOB|nr:hypothetical protein SAMN06265373_10250 [Shimia sagamensis]